MTYEEERTGRAEEAASKQPFRGWMDGGIEWLISGGSRTAGASVRAMKKAGAAIADATSGAARQAKVSAKAADELFISALNILPKEITIGNRVRTRKRIRRIQKEIARLTEKRRRKTESALSAGRTDAARDIEVERLSAGIRLWEDEIAQLREQLGSASTPKAMQGASIEVKPKAQLRSSVLDKARSAAGGSAMSKPSEARSPASEPVVPARKRKRQVRQAVKSRLTETRLRRALEKAIEGAEFSKVSEKMEFQQTVKQAIEGNPAAVREAIESLKNIDRPVVTRILRLLGENSKVEIRTQALTALAQREDEVSLPLFQEAVKDSSARIRMAALRGLYKLLSEGASPYLIDALEDEDAGVRRRAVMCLGWIGDRRAFPKLLRLLEDPEPVVRRAVTVALGASQSRGAIVARVPAVSEGNIPKPSGHM